MAEGSVRGFRPSQLGGEARPIPRWEELGWSHAPRNGHENKMIENGQGPPRSKLRLNCRRCNSPYILVGQGEKRQRACPKCRRQAELRYQKRHPERVRAARAISFRNIQQKKVPVDPSGITEIEQSWFRLHISEVASRVAQGEKFIVLIYKVPAYWVQKFEERS